MNWNTLNNSKQINKIVELSHIKPQIIFKHSRTCPISAISMSRLESGSSALEDADIYYLDLLSYRSVSNDVASMLGVHHESPQVIVLSDGEVSYDESHLDISVTDILDHFNYLKNGDK